MIFRNNVANSFKNFNEHSLSETRLFMRLRRYLRTHAVETLRDKKMMVSVPSVFNDPYDCLPQMSEIEFADVRKIVERNPAAFAKIWTNGKIQKIRKKTAIRKIWHALQKDPKMIAQLNDIRAIFEELYYICCFECPELTDSKSEWTMWRKYTGHQGIRIEFEVELNDRVTYWTHKIEYVDKLPKCKLSDFYHPNIEERRILLEKISTTKTKKWSYENEYRFFTTPEFSEFSKILGEQRRFFSFDGVFQVTGIDFGLRCPSQDKVKVLKLIQHDAAYPYSRVTVRQAQSFHNGRITYRPITDLGDLF